MEITYIGHSGFLVETERNNYLFDYYRGEIPKLPTDKPLYVFASHKHPDHFNPVIFDLAKRSMQRSPLFFPMISKSILFICVNGT